MFAARALADNRASGWSSYERVASTQLKRFDLEGGASWRLVLDISDPKGKSYTGPEKFDPWAATRGWPIGPEEFDAMIRTQAFPDEADVAVVQNLFRKLRVRQLGGAKRLKFDSTMPPPSVEDGRRFGHCLNICVNCEKLGLADVGMSDEAAKQLFSALGHGSLEKLTALTLFNNSIADEGCVAFARAATDGAMPKLASLSLASNLIKERGARTLALALADGHLPSLEELSIGDNAFSDASRAELSEVCAARGIRAKKDRNSDKPLWDDSPIERRR